MRPDRIHSRVLGNGLAVVVEVMPDVQSAAFSLLVPGGSIYDAQNRGGTAAILTEMITRGAGSRDSRELLTALENLGLQHSESVGSQHVSFSGATLCENLAPSLRIYSEIVRTPHLDEQEFEPAQLGIEQSLRSIEDEPRQKILVELRKRTYDRPWGLPNEGSLEELPQITHADVVRHFQTCFRPNGAILGIAGKVDPTAIFDVVHTAFGDWSAKTPPEVITGPRGKRFDHIHLDSTQTQIGIAYDAVPYRHPDYYAAWAAVSVLSGGSSARLFTEVRERRGLCYAVQASLHTLLHEGRVLGYAGTTAERAQETLTVTLAEMRRLGEGIAQDELDRCKARAKSALIMQQESTMARAGSIARDWYHLGRITTLDEVRDQVDNLSVRQVLDYVHAHPARNFTILTLGPAPLEVPDEVS